MVRSTLFVRLLFFVLHVATWSGWWRSSEIFRGPCQLDFMVLSSLRLFLKAFNHDDRPHIWTTAVL